MQRGRKPPCQSGFWGGWRSHSVAPKTHLATFFLQSPLEGPSARSRRECTSARLPVLRWWVGCALRWGQRMGFCHHPVGVAPWASMALWPSVDALILQAAAVDPGFVSGMGQRLVDGFLPQLPQAVSAALLRKVGHPLPRVDVPIPNEDMNMGIGLILALVVDRRQPCGATSGDFTQISAGEGLPLRGRKFERQGSHDLVDHAGILAVLLFLSVQPILSGLAPGGHVFAHDESGGAAAGDIAGMGCRRACRVGGPPDAVVMQAENRHAASLAGCPASTQTWQDQTGQLSPTNRRSTGTFRLTHHGGRTGGFAAREPISALYPPPRTVAPLLRLLWAAVTLRRRPTPDILFSDDGVLS